MTKLARVSAVLLALYFSGASLGLSLEEKTGGHVHVHQMKPDGAVGNEIDRKEWSRGWTTASFFTIGAKSYLFLLKELDGQVMIRKVKRNGAIGKKVDRRNWGKGWTTATFFNRDSKLYLLLLKESDGTVHIHQVNTDGTIGGILERQAWASGWTTASYFSVRGAPYLFLLNQSDGRVQIHTMGANGAVGDQVGHHDWSSGWTTARFFDIASSTYLFLLKQSSGEVVIHEMSEGGVVGREVERHDWSDGWTTASFFESGGKPYLFLLKSSSGQVSIRQMNENGTIGDEVESHDWSAGWTTAAFLAREPTPTLLLLKEGDWRRVAVDAERLQLYKNSPVSLKGGTGGGVLIAPRVVLTVAHNGIGDPVYDRYSCNWGSVTADRTIRPDDIEFGAQTTDRDRLDGVGWIADYDFRATPAPAGSSADEDCPDRPLWLTDLGVWIMQRPTSVAQPLWNPIDWEDADGPLTMISGRGELRLAVANCANFSDTVDEKMRYLDCENDAFAGPGDSGSPVFDRQGRLVAIHQSTGNRGMQVWKFKDWIEDRIEAHSAHLIIGQLDGDEFPDFYFATRDDSDWIDYSSEENGVAKRDLPSGGADRVGIESCPSWPRLVDFDQDGVDELLCIRTAGRQVTAQVGDLSGRAGGSSPYAYDLALPVGSKVVAIGDFDADGFPDIFVHAEGRVRLGGWLTTPRARKSYNYLFRSSSRVGAAAGLPAMFGKAELLEENGFPRIGPGTVEGHFNPDDSTDLLYWDMRSEGWAIRFFEKGTFGERHDQPLTGCTSQPFVGDLDADGLSDILCFDSETDELSIFIAANWRYPTLFQEPDTRLRGFDWCQGDHKQWILRDVSGDQRADLVCYDSWSGLVEINLNSGDSLMFDARTNLQSPQYPWGR